MLGITVLAATFRSPAYGRCHHYLGDDSHPSTGGTRAGAPQFSEPLNNRVINNTTSSRERSSKRMLYWSLMAQPSPPLGSRPSYVRSPRRVAANNEPQVCLMARGDSTLVSLLIDEEQPLAHPDNRFPANESILQVWGTTGACL
ncbi:hypothetical protein MRX96_023933 [Rhipicephalus microplus]